MGKYKRKIRRGFILKRDFCKEYDISISDFNKKLQEKGYLINKLISEDMFGGRKKYALGININSGHILPLHGSNQQGTFQYSKKFLLDVFDIESLTKDDYSNYKLNFGKHKGLKLSEMVTDDQKQYLQWLHGEMVKKNDTATEKFRAINWFVTNIENDGH